MDKITLKKQQDFDLINKSGKKEFAPCFLIVMFSNYSAKKSFDPGVFYYGLKVSKKFSKKAVDRNKAKRRIRALLDLLTKENPDLAGSALVFIPKKNFNNYPFEKIYRYLNKIISEI